MNVSAPSTGEITPQETRGVTREIERTLPVSVPIVLFVDDWGSVGGTAGYAKMMARSLRARGYRVAAVCYANDGSQPMRQSLAGLGVEVRAMPAGSGPRAAWRRHRWFTRMFRSYGRPLSLLLMGYHTRGGGALLGGAQARVPVVRADLTPPEPPYSRLEGLSLRLKDRFTDAIVVGARDNIWSFSSNLGRDARKMHVIHTGIELDRFRPGEGGHGVRHELGIDPEAPVVGTVARLSDERKGIRDFLHAAAQLRAIAPGVRFIVAGDGVLRPDLERLSAELGLSGSCVFAGWRDDVAAILDAMDVFVMPSHFEGGPTSVLEAMAMARAVVASRVGMVPEVIDDGTSGLIVPPADAMAIRDAVFRLLSSDAERRAMALAARSKALLDFSVERMVDRYMVLARSVYERRRERT